jgi:CBS-domain-containing membrane protein
MADPTQPRSPAAGGILLVGGVLIGAIIGITIGEASLGAVIGLAAGTAAALAIWLRDRRK